MCDLVTYCFSFLLFATSIRKSRAVLCLVASVMSNSLQCGGLPPAMLLCPWDSSGKNTGVGCHALLQGIFLTQESDPCLLPCRQILYRLSHQGILTLSRCETNSDLRGYLVKEIPSLPPSPAVAAPPSQRLELFRVASASSGSWLKNLRLEIWVGWLS